MVYIFHLIFSTEQTIANVYISVYSIHPITIVTRKHNEIFLMKLF